MKDFVVVDIETTGFIASTDEITQIAACKVQNSMLVGKFDHFVKIQGTIPQEVQRLTGISMSDLADANSIGEVLQEFIDFCGDLPFVIHNVCFDYNFLREKSRVCGLENDLTLRGQRKGVDTLSLCRRLYPSVSHKLDAMIEYLKIPRLEGSYHNALYDAFMTKQLYTYLLSKYDSMYDVREPDFLQKVSEGRAISNGTLSFT